MRDYAISDCIENPKIKETYLAVIDVASIDIQHQLEHTTIGIGQPRQEVIQLQNIPRAEMNW